jgi:hypothetical protein
MIKHSNIKSLNNGKSNSKTQFININPRQLNINTILKKNKKHVENNDNSINLNSDITIINNILNNNSLQNPKTNTNLLSSQINNNNKYKIVKYLGEGIQGSLYLANDSEKKRYICKKITLDTQNNSNQINQIELELNILKYLSLNKVTKEYINPCIEHKIIDNNIFTIFPVFDGYSLNHLSKYLMKLDNSSYYKIILHLIKTILHGMAKIHQHKVAHQNINENSILVSTYTNPKEIYINFTDFGLGCGNHNMNKPHNISNLMNINKYEDGEYGEEYNNSNLSKIKFNTCKVNNFSPVKITDNIMSELLDSDYLFISQKYDLLCLGIIFLKLLLFFDNINIDFKKGYNNLVMQKILQLLNDKYLKENEIVKESEKDKDKDKKAKKVKEKYVDYKLLFPFLSVDNEVKQDILEYIKLIKEYILCKTVHRKTCQYVLDKIIIYEKYRNEVF